MLNSIDSEQIVLAGLCQNGQDAMIDIVDIISPDCFTDAANQAIYRSLNESLKNANKVDTLVVNVTANKMGYGDLINKDYLNDLYNTNVEIGTVVHHAKILARLSITRKLQFEVKKIYSELGNVKGDEAISKVLSIAEKPIFDFANSINNADEQPVLIGSSIFEHVKNLKNAEKGAVGISSGWARWDKYIGGGFRRKTISLVGARMKVGKSVLADNVAIHVAHRLRIPVLMLDTEMATEDHQTRLLAYFSKISINSIEEGSFAHNPTLEAKINKAAKHIFEMPYTYKNVSGKDFDEILSIIHRWLHKVVGVDASGRRNDCLVIYDYFKLMTSDRLKELQEFQALGFQISDLHNFCVKYDFPVLSFVQLNRDGITKDTTDVVSQSDRLLWLCTNFSLFKAKDDKEIVTDGAEFGNRKLIPIIARHGPGIEEGNYINMYMQGEYAMVEELRSKAEIVKDLSDDKFEIEESEDAPFE